ncbi:MAG: LacI family DNA-binding transcriptional regulator [Clostridia bacterium]|nr:LacI family DNA-binding transcriptional regulator [Clostridia bacterium]
MADHYTIYDIAAEAGVSIATVSRVMRGEMSVSPKTRAKVEAVISRLNYQPSSIARGMTSKTTNNLGIVLPKLLNPNYAMIFTGANDEARRQGYSMTLFPWRSITGQDEHQTQALAERRLDGVIICVEYMPDNEREQFLTDLKKLRQYMPIVLIGCVPRTYDFPAISYNMAGIVRESVSALIGLGHRRIALIGGMESDQDELRRDVGYQEGLKDARLPYVSSYRVFCGGKAEDGEAALNDLLDGLQEDFWPTAVIALNDLVAMGCTSAAQKRGLRVPDDISVLGCDNIFCAPYLTPPLASIDMHQQQLGARAVELLLSGENKREEAQWEMIMRGSVAPCK